jgi:hypothetical protein
MPVPFVKGLVGHLRDCVAEILQLLVALVLVEAARASGGCAVGHRHACPNKCLPRYIPACNVVELLQLVRPLLGLRVLFDPLQRDQWRRAASASFPHPEFPHSTAPAKI